MSSRLARMVGISDFLKGKPITQNVIGGAIFQTLYQGGSGVISYIAGRSAYIKGLELHWAILLGAVVFLLLAVAANVMSALIYRHRYGQVGSNYPARSNKPLSAVCSSPVHEIEEFERNHIHSSVINDQCVIMKSDFTGKRPFVEFCFYVFNGSVFDISIDETFDGDIRFQGQPLDGPLKMIEGTKNVPHAQRARLIIRQGLTKEEADAIQQVATDGTEENIFYFDSLMVFVHGGDAYPEIERKRVTLLRGIHKTGTPL